jgi:hypothetical protein
MAKKANLQKLQKRVQDPAFYRDLRTVKGLWEEVLHAYGDNPGDDNFAWLVQTTYENMEKAVPNFDPSQQKPFADYLSFNVSTQYTYIEQEGKIVEVKYVDKRGDPNIGTLKDLPGVVSIANKLQGLTEESDVRTQVISDIENKDRELVHIAIERQITDQGTLLDRFRCMPPDKEEGIFNLLKNSYIAVRATVVDDYEEDKAIREFERIEKGGYEADDDFRAAQKAGECDIDEHHEKLSGIQDDLLENVDRDVLVRAEGKGKAEGVVQRYDAISETLDIGIDFLDSETMIPKFYELRDRANALIHAFNNPKEGELRNIDAHKQEIRRIKSEFDVSITSARIERAAEVSGGNQQLVADYAAFDKRFKTHTNSLEDESILIAFERRCHIAESKIEEFEREMEKYRNGELETVPNPRSKLVEVNRVLSDYFDSSEALEDITKVAKKRNDPGIVERFRAKRRELMKRVFDLESDYISASGEEGKKETTVEMLRIAGFNVISDEQIQSLKDEELRDWAMKYNKAVHSISAESVDPKHYEMALTSIAKVKNVFEDGRKRVDDSIKGHIDECVRKMEAISVGIRANKCRKVDVKVDPEKAKAEIKSLVPEADKYVDIDPNLPEFAREIKAIVEKFAIYGIEDALERRLPKDEEEKDSEKLSRRVRDHSINLRYVGRTANIHQYEELLKRLEDGRTVFVSKKKRATTDQKAAIDECVRKIEALTIRTRLQKYLKFDVYLLESNNAKAGVDQLVKDAEPYAELDADLLDFAKNIRDRVHEVVILGPEKAAESRGEKPAEIAERIKLLKEAGLMPGAAVGSAPRAAVSAPAPSGVKAGARRRFEEPAASSTPRAAVSALAPSPTHSGAATKRSDDSAPAKVGAGVGANMLNFNQASSELEIEADELQNLIQTGELRAFRSGGIKVFRRADIDGLKKERDLSIFSGFDYVHGEFTGDKPETLSLYQAHHALTRIEGMPDMTESALRDLVRRERLTLTEFAVRVKTSDFEGLIKKLKPELKAASPVSGAASGAKEIVFTDEDLKILPLDRASDEGEPTVPAEEPVTPARPERLSRADALIPELEEKKRAKAVETQAEAELEAILATNPDDNQTIVTAMETYANKLESVSDGSEEGRQKIKGIRDYIANIKRQAGMEE